MEEERPLTKAERKAMRKAEKREMQAASTKRQGMKKALWILVILAIMASVIWWAYNRYVPTPSGEGNKAVDKVLNNDWYKGNNAAKVVVVEYSDFQCPACRLYSPLIKNLAQAYGDKIGIVYRHFPLKQIHMQAELAAYAAEAAGKQGKFWEMNELLFDRQADWSEKREAKKLFISYAKELSLNEDQFKKDLVSKEVKGLVKADYLSGLANRLNSTPSFFVNGQRIQSPQGEQAFREIIDLKLREATTAADLTN